LFEIVCLSSYSFKLFVIFLHFEDINSCCKYVNIKIAHCSLCSFSIFNYKFLNSKFQKFYNDVGGNIDF